MKVGAKVAVVGVLPRCDRRIESLREGIILVLIDWFLWWLTPFSAGEDMGDENIVDLDLTWPAGDTFPDEGEGEALSRPWARHRGPFCAGKLMLLGRCRMCKHSSVPYTRMVHEKLLLRACTIELKANQRLHMQRIVKDEVATSESSSVGPSLLIIRRVYIRLHGRRSSVNSRASKSSRALRASRDSQTGLRIVKHQDLSSRLRHYFS